MAPVHDVEEITGAAAIDPGIEDVVAKRIGVKGSLGFGAVSRRDTSKTELLRQITPEDLMAFGMIPELVGRLPVSVGLTTWIS